jgi:hypothetical protein
MLTRNDVTVDDAPEVLALLCESGLRYLDFKDIGRPSVVLAEVTGAAHDAGIEVILEVVSTRVEDELGSLRAALDIGLDTGYSEAPTPARELRFSAAVTSVTAPSRASSWDIPASSKETSR